MFVYLRQPHHRRRLQVRPRSPRDVVQQHRQRHRLRDRPEVLILPLLPRPVVVRIRRQHPRQPLHPAQPLRPQHRLRSRVMRAPPKHRHLLPAVSTHLHHPQPLASVSVGLARRPARHQESIPLATCHSTSPRSAARPPPRPGETESPKPSHIHVPKSRACSQKKKHRHRYKFLPHGASATIVFEKEGSRCQNMTAFTRRVSLLPSTSALHSVLGSRSAPPATPRPVHTKVPGKSTRNGTQSAPSRSAPPAPRIVEASESAVLCTTPYDTPPCVKSAPITWTGLAPATWTCKLAIITTGTSSP